LPEALGERLTAIVFTVVVTSIIVHGVSVTPLMSRYQRHASARAHARADAR
jgi:NhaP-type Na+/H+ or K+/H+ antiporter